MWDDKRALSWSLRGGEALVGDGGGGCAATGLGLEWDNCSCVRYCRKGVVANADGLMDDGGGCGGRDCVATGSILSCDNRNCLSSW